MKAIMNSKYGSPDVLEFKEVEKPVPDENEVLVKVHASSLNSWDYDFLKGTFFNRLMGGIRKPKYKILGSDIAGKIEAVGRNIEQFQPGDEVFGDISGFGPSDWGGFAEFVCARENVLAHKPASISFQEAAALPQSGIAALQGLRYGKKIQPGQNILINGAGGGMGTFAVQIAKYYGAEVTGVDSTGKLDMIRSIGADHVIDYTQEDFTKNGEQYDLILDLVCYRSIFHNKRALSSNGAYVMIGGSTVRIFQVAFLAPFISKLSSKKMGILGVTPNQKDLNTLIELFETGKVLPVIDKRYQLSEVSESFRYFSEGKFIGKIIITM